MSSRKISLFYVVLIALATMAVTAVITSRMDLTPSSSAQSISVPAINSAPLSGPLDAATFRNIAKAAAPAVVNIQTIGHARGRDLTEYFGGQGDDLLRRFFGGGGAEQAPRGRRPNAAPEIQGAGTGFIIDKAGYILTNNHVVEGADDIKVSLFGAAPNESYEAKVIGRDLLLDCALIKMNELPKQPLTEVKFGDSAELEPGDWVMAIGNPFRLGHSVTVGVISGLGRPFGGVNGREQPMLQTDAAINPGNSGGPLLNIRGEVVGMNTAIYTDRSEANIGIGFANPINALRDIIPQLRNGKVVRGVIGVQVSKELLTPETAKAFGLPNTSGAIVASVNANGPAAKSGIEPGDVVVSYNGKPVKDSDALVNAVVNTKPGTTVPITIYRDNDKKTLSITVDELDLEAEQGRSARGGTEEPSEPAQTGFGMTLDAITPQMASRLDLPRGEGGAIVSDVDSTGPAASAGVAPGDVILEVNRQKVATVSQATRELQKVETGHPAFLLVWRDGQTTFISMTKR